MTSHRITNLPVRHSARCPERGYLADMSDSDDEITGEFGDEFDLGDGTADTGTVVLCPYCGEANEISVDPGSGTTQSYVEDCQVCCQPWSVHVTFDAEGRVAVDVGVLE